MQFIDAPENPVNAIREGRLQVTNLDDFRRIEESIQISPERVEEINKRGEELYGEAGGQVKTKNLLDFYMQALRDLMTSPPAEWSAIFFIILFNPDDKILYYYSLSVANGEVVVDSGLKEGIQPTCEMKTDVASFINLLRYMKSKALGEISDELSDEELEAVAGGKGSNVCGAEGCGGDACTTDVCGAEGCGADASGSCSTEGGGVCGADGCGGAACGGDSCAAAVCGAEACGYAICSAEACAADVCGIDVLPGVPFI